MYTVLFVCYFVTHLSPSLSFRVCWSVCLSACISANLTICWPDPAESEEEEVPDVARNIVEQLLCHDPAMRLGSSARGGGQ